MRKKRLFGKNFKLRYAMTAVGCCLALLCAAPILGETYGTGSTITFSAIISRPVSV